MVNNQILHKSKKLQNNKLICYSKNYNKKITIIMIYMIKIANNFKK